MLGCIGAATGLSLRTGRISRCYASSRISWRDFQLSLFTFLGMNIWRILGHVAVVVLSELLNKKKQKAE